MDIIVGIGQGLEMPDRAIESTFDIARRSVTNHKSCPLALQVKGWVALGASTRIADRAEKLLEKDEFFKEIRKMRPDIVKLQRKAIERGLDELADPKTLSVALKAGDMALDRDPETAKTQKHEHSGEVVEHRVVHLPPGLVQHLSLAVNQIREITGDVIDAEPVE